MSKFRRGSAILLGALVAGVLGLSAYDAGHPIVSDFLIANTSNTSWLAALVQRVVLPYTVVPKPRPEQWWQARHQNLVARAHQGGGDLLFLGDSITALMDIKLLRSTFGAGAENFGISGDGTQHLLWRVQNGELPTTPAPKVVVILIGTNNIQSVHRLSASGRHDVFLGVQANVDAVRARLPQAKILVLGILPREQSAQHPIRKEIGLVNQELSTLADSQHIFYADIGADMLEPNGDLSRQVMSDLLHPTPVEGYGRMFGALKPVVDQLLH